MDYYRQDTFQDDVFITQLTDIFCGCIHAHERNIEQINV